MDVPPGQRKSCLDALSRELAYLELPGGAPDLSQIRPPALEVIEAFVGLVPRLTTEQRDAIVERLLEADLLEIRSPFESGVLADVRERLKMDPAAEIDTDRLGVVFASLVMAVVTLDQVVWKLWRREAPKSNVGRDHWNVDFAALLRRSLSGDAEASAAQVQHHLEATRQLIAGLLTSLTSAGRLYSGRYQARRSPDAIREAIKSERVKNLLTSADVACWKQYCTVTDGVSADTIEEEVREVVVWQAEDLMLGSRRGGAKAESR
jgi:hypothetical protein